MQLLHTPGRTDRFAALTSHARSGSSRTRRLTAVTEVEEEVWGCMGKVVADFMPVFQEYVRLIALAPAAMTEWNKDAAKVLQGRGCSMNEVESLLEVAKGFPIQLPLAVDVASLLSRARDLEREVTEALAKDAADEREVQRLEEEVRVWLT